MIVCNAVLHGMLETVLPDRVQETSKPAICQTTTDCLGAMDKTCKGSTGVLRLTPGFPAAIAPATRLP